MRNLTQLTDLCIRQEQNNRLNVLISWDELNFLVTEARKAELAAPSPYIDTENNEG